ncbi:MAG: dipeptidase PepE [Bacteroidales bacterium]|jgi:dipeptidase E|nr:dipeptidase PepE [Bacteroidales bacterium]
MRLLLISNSTNPGEAYLDYPKHNIKDFLGDKPINCLFIPYAAVTFSFDEYVDKVNNRLAEVGHKVTGIHTYDNMVEAVEKAEAIVVGGGNTWQLVRMLQENNLMEAIVKKVKGGTPYVGWSAGSNIACPTLKTTNDMPITEPPSFDTLNLVPFQINPHYLDDTNDTHGGETRETRITEFVHANKEVYVVGLREGCMLKLEDNKMEMIGSRTARIFHYGKDTVELSNKDDFNFLIKK